MAFLLDTNIVSDLIRNPRGRVAARMARAGEEQVFISVIVAAELRFGVVRRLSPVLSQKVDALLDRFPILPIEPPVDRFYAKLRTELESAGTPIGANDMLIAAHVLALGCTLVTDNVREFSQVRQLSIENWLR